MALIPSGSSQKASDLVFSHQKGAPSFSDHGSFPTSQEGKRDWVKQALYSLQSPIGQVLGPKQNLGPDEQLASLKSKLHGDFCLRNTAQPHGVAPTYGGYLGWHVIN